MDFPGAHEGGPGTHGGFPGVHGGFPCPGAQGLRTAFGSGIDISAPINMLCDLLTAETRTLTNVNGLRIVSGTLLWTDSGACLKCMLDAAGAIVQITLRTTSRASTRAKVPSL